MTYKKRKERVHIVEGLMKALSILDEVIATIRASKDKRDAKNNLIAKFEFTEAQAEAIVSLTIISINKYRYYSFKKRSRGISTTD